MVYTTFAYYLSVPVRGSGINYQFSVFIPTTGERCCYFVWTYKCIIMNVHGAVRYNVRCRQYPKIEYNMNVLSLKWSKLPLWNGHENEYNTQFNVQQMQYNNIVRLGFMFFVNAAAYVFVH